MSGQNKEVVRRYVEAIYNQGDLDQAAELVTADYVNHAGFQTVEGVQGLQAFAGMLRTAFPDFHEVLEDQIEAGDKEVHRYTITGTHQGEFLGIPATGKKISVSGITIARLRDGKIAEEWSQVDMLSVMQKLGLVPAMG